MVPFFSRLAVGLGVTSLLAASACASNRDALYTQMSTPDDARIVDGDPHLVDDHGNVQVHSSHKLDALPDARDKLGDLSTDADNAAEKLRDR